MILYYKIILSLVKAGGKNMNHHINYPTFEDILKQLTVQFPEAHVNLSTEELEDLSRILSDTFEQMKKTEYQGFAKSDQPTPSVQLRRWQNARIRDDRKYYSADYSTIDVSIKKYQKAEIHIVNVWGVKRIELHFVSVITDEERNQMMVNCVSLMDRMKIDKNEQTNLMARILAKLI